MNYSDSLRALKDVKEKNETANRAFLEDFSKLLKELELVGGLIRTRSKEAINAAINDDFKKTRVYLSEAHKQIRGFSKTLFKARQILGRLLIRSQLSTGELQTSYARLDGFERDFSDAKEEFFEALILDAYLCGKGTDAEAFRTICLPDFDSYAGALSDFCGELLRKARLQVLQGGSQERLHAYYKEVGGVYQALAQFGFSNKSGVRSKVERLKGHILGFEDVLYDLRKGE